MNSPPKSKTRIINDDVSARTRSKANQLDQHVGVSTRSKLQQTYNLSIQTLLCPLHGIIPLTNHERSNNENLELGVKECKVYHDDLMKSKYSMDFDRLHHLHRLDLAGEDRYTSWQCSKMLNYNHDREENDGIQHNFLVE